MPWALMKAIPSQEDFKKKYPEDQAADMVNSRQQNVVAMDNYINQMKEYAKDDRNIWIVMKEKQDKERKAYAKADAHKQRVASEELAARRAEMRREVSSGS
ncbi:hypothetical protein BT63DRAFT_424699 [Microthyrium microscopicum]|uniref:Cytochrome b mRNA-processing protein 4 n=1 Tax=Microthyrium microscopicum TaxID=703497 RepID=A0A6A6U9M7_9PEZI|nr:hypothetical protein BT63DRAFT_424699 [Microthyrium microscopicum]